MNQRVYQAFETWNQTPRTTLGVQIPLAQGDPQSTTQCRPGGVTRGPAEQAIQESDAQLVAWMASGESTALAQLYDRHAPRMLGLARRILGERQEAEDLLHDVFLQAWQQAATYDPKRGSVRAWLTTRTRSRAIDRLRTIGVAHRHASSVDDSQPRAKSRDADRNLDLLDRGRARRAMAELSQSHLRVVQLCYFNGLSCREVAERTGVPIGTVKSRLSAALSKLRRELGVSR